MVRATCSALHCNSSSRTHHDLKFHQFPHDAKRRKIWLLACKRMDVIDKDWDFFKYKYVCSKHFQKCMYSKSDNLKRSAVPTLYLSEKPLKYDSSTQTEESIENERSNFQQHVDVKEETQNSASTLYVMPDVEKRSTYTQIEDIPNDINNINIKEETITNVKEETITNIKEETITDQNIEESEMGEQDVETHTESDHDNESSNTTSFEDIDMKIEIVENPILPTQLTHSTDVKISKVSQENYQSKTATVNVEKSPVSNKFINTDTLAMNRIKDKSVQTEKVIVLSQNTGEESINPKDCQCMRIIYDDITRAQFFRLCSRFLSPDFCILVKTQMCLDSVTKKNETVQAGTKSNRNNNDTDPFFEHQGVITPEVGVAITQMYLNGVTKLVNNDLSDAGSSGSEGAGVAKCVKRSAAKSQKVVSPEMFVFNKQIYLDGVRKLLRNDLVKAGSSGSEEAGIDKDVKESQKEVTSEMIVAGKHMDLAHLPKPFENDGTSSIGSLCDEETAAKRPKVSVPKIVIPFTGTSDNAEDDLFDM